MGKHKKHLPNAINSYFGNKILVQKLNGKNCFMMVSKLLNNCQNKAITEKA